MMSTDGLKTTSRVPFQSDASQQYDTYVAQGFLKISANNQDYFLISAAQGPVRIGGKIFLYEGDLTNRKLMSQEIPHHFYTQHLNYYIKKIITLNLH